MQVQIFGPPILRRSAGGPLPLAELRRKAAGSGEEDEKTSAGSPSIQAKALPVPPAAPDLSRMPAFPSGDAPLASLLRRAPAPAPPSPERPGAAPAAPPASPGSPVPFSPESFPLPVALQRSVAPPGALPENLPGAAPSGAAPGAPAGPLPGHAAPPSGGPAPLSRIARGLSLPLARAVQPGAGPAGSAAGTVQREVTAAPGTTPPASEPPVIGGGDAPQAGAAGTAQNDDELVERVLRRLMRTLTVEGERRGARRWP